MLWSQFTTLLFIVIFCIVYKFEFVSLMTVKELVTKQKNTLCTINKSPYNAHTESLFKKSKILPLTLLNDYFWLQLIHQFTYNHLPVSFSNTWYHNTVRREDQSGPVLCNENNYYVPFSRLVSIERHTLVLSTKVQNKFMDLEIKGTVSPD